jgi:hypothetical protein
MGGMAGWLVLISTYILLSLSLSLKPRLSGSGRVAWPGGGAGSHGRSPPPRAPPRRPGDGAGRRRWQPPPALHLDGGPPLCVTSKVTPPACDLQGDPLLRVTPTADRGRTQQWWLDLLHGESQTPRSPSRPVVGGATCSSLPPPEGARAPPPRPWCPPRHLDGMAAVGRRTACSRTNMRILRSRSA